MSGKKTALIVVLATIFSYFVATKIGENDQRKKDVINKLIGKKILIDGDTLTILKYDKNKHSYMLKYDTQISRELAKELLIENQ